MSDAMSEGKPDEWERLAISMFFSMRAHEAER